MKNKTDSNPLRNGENQESITFELHLRYTSGTDCEISEQKIKEIEEKKQEIDHKYGKDLVTFFKDNCEKGADVTLKLVDILQKLRII